MPAHRMFTLALGIEANVPGSLHLCMHSSSAPGQAGKFGTSHDWQIKSGDRPDSLLRRAPPRCSLEQAVVRVDHCIQAEFPFDAGAVGGAEAGAERGVGEQGA